MEEKIAQLRSMATSELISLIINHTVLMQWAFGEDWIEKFSSLEPPSVVSNKINAAVAPVLAAIAAEIDRRIPVPA